jgi:DNA-binding SARP family transcriptional activator/TolB-like protein
MPKWIIKCDHAGYKNALVGICGDQFVRAVRQVTLLGQFALRDADGRPIAVPAKGRALLAYLLLQHGRPVRREALSELLWPERGEVQARNSLKQELYVLRRDGFGGEEAIITVGATISLPPDNITSDVYHLQTLLHANPPWQSITSLYAGPLLKDFPPISSPFDDWLAATRGALEADILTALEKIAAADPTIALAERILAIDPLREDSQRLLMQRYADADRRADALRLYTDSKTLLLRELDVAPSRETEALIARIRDRSDTPTQITIPPTPGRNGPPRIAVLPLRQSPDQPIPSHLSDGITADIITQLAGLRELTVISHGSTFSLRDPNTHPHEIGRKLNARYLVIGRIRTGGDRLRLTTELTEAESGQIIYSHTDDAAATLSFDDQDRIVARLVNALVPQVRETELRRIRGQRPTVFSVYEKILLSREQIMMLERDRFDEAKMLLDEVIDEDPGYGEAYALAADWHGVMVGERWSTDPAAQIAEVERLTKIALRHDNCNLRALLSHAHRRTMSKRDHGGAMRVFQQALDVAPSSAHAWALSGLCLAFSGQPEEAVRRASWALDLSPYDGEAYKFYYALCVAKYTAGDYEQAVAWGLRALAEKKFWGGTRGFTAASLAALGRLQEARAVTAEIVSLFPRRRLAGVLRDMPYQDPARLTLYGDHLRAAGFPD